MILSARITPFAVRDGEQMRPVEPHWVNGVISAGIDYLGSKIAETHPRLWRDFKLEGVSQGSTEWLSAFIAMQIGTIPEARALAIETVLALLALGRPSGGWGYRADVPEDCDSTACVLLAALAAGVPLSESLRQRSTQFMLSHQQEDGGFTTYGRETWSAIMADGRADWFASEVSVTANSILALRATDCPVPAALHRARTYLLTAHKHGLWQSFWCKGFGYATLYSLLALHIEGDEATLALTRISRRAILNSRGGSGGWSIASGADEDSFSTAMALRALLTFGSWKDDHDTIAQAVIELGRYQTPLGNFIPGVEMLAPGGMNGLNVVLRDKGLITTACAIRAFHDYRMAVINERAVERI